MPKVKPEPVVPVKQEPLSNLTQREAKAIATFGLPKNEKKVSGPKSPEVEPDVETVKAKVEELKQAAHLAIDKLREENIIKGNPDSEPLLEEMDNLEGETTKKLEDLTVAVQLTDNETKNQVDLKQTEEAKDQENEKSLPEKEENLKAEREDFAKLEAALKKDYAGFYGWFKRSLKASEYENLKEQRDSAYDKYIKTRAEIVKEEIMTIVDERLALVEAQAKEFAEKNGWGEKFYDKWKKLGKVRMVANFGLLGAGFVIAGPAGALGTLAVRRFLGAIGSGVGSYDLMTMGLDYLSTKVKLDKNQEKELKAYAKENNLGFLSKKKDQGYQEKLAAFQAEQANQMTEKELKSALAYHEAKNIMAGKNPYVADKIYKLLIEEQKKRDEYAMTNSEDLDLKEIDNIEAEKDAEKETQENVTKRRQAVLEAMITRAKEQDGELDENFRKIDKNKKIMKVAAIGIGLALGSGVLQGMLTGHEEVANNGLSTPKPGLDSVSTENSGINFSVDNTPEMLMSEGLPAKIETITSPIINVAKGDSLTGLARHLASGEGFNGIKNPAEAQKMVLAYLKEKHLYSQDGKIMHHFYNMHPGDKVQFEFDANGKLTNITGINTDQAFDRVIPTKVPAVGGVVDQPVKVDSERFLQRTVLDKAGVLNMERISEIPGLNAEKYKLIDKLGNEIYQVRKDYYKYLKAGNQEQADIFYKKLSNLVFDANQSLFDGTQPASADIFNFPTKVPDFSDYSKLLKDKILAGNFSDIKSIDEATDLLKKLNLAPSSLQKLAEQSAYGGKMIDLADAQGHPIQLPQDWNFTRGARHLLKDLKDNTNVLSGQAAMEAFGSTVPEAVDNLKYINLDQESLEKLSKAKSIGGKIIKLRTADGAYVDVPQNWNYIHGAREVLNPTDSVVEAVQDNATETLNEANVWINKVGDASKSLMNEKLPFAKRIAKITELLADTNFKHNLKINDYIFEKMDNGAIKVFSPDNKSSQILNKDNISKLVKLIKEAGRNK